VKASIDEILSRMRFPVGEILKEYLFIILVFELKLIPECGGIGFVKKAGQEAGQFLE